MRYSPWLVGSPLATRKLRLYCFSYAGGGAHAYKSWQKDLGPEIEVCAVQLPGRGMRMAEAPCTSLQELIVNLAHVLSKQDKTPFVFFGHSLGAIVAFELARFCARHSLYLPQRLIVSGANPPQHRDSSKALHELPDNELIEELKEYDGSPPEVLEDEELMALLLPMIRADFALGEKYTYRAAPLLNIPITVFVGNEDSHGKSETALEWQKETYGRCRVHLFEGGHFFIQSDKDAVLSCLKAELTEAEEVSG
jgi:surfactin synthase thioesterase subunit